MKPFKVELVTIKNLPTISRWPSFLRFSKTTGSGRMFDIMSAR